jgi:hypothetical protein
MHWEIRGARGKLDEKKKLVTRGERERERERRSTMTHRTDENDC